MRGGGYTLGTGGESRVLLTGLGIPAASWGMFLQPFGANLPTTEPMLQALISHTCLQGILVETHGTHGNHSATTRRTYHASETDWVYPHFFDIGRVFFLLVINLRQACLSQTPLRLL